MPRSYLWLLLFGVACSESQPTSDEPATGASTSESEVTAVPLNLECAPVTVDETTRFSPAAGISGSTAVGRDDARIVGWVNTVEEYLPGTNVDPEWQDTTQATGPAEGTAFDVLSLGEGGYVVIPFDPPLTDHAGPEFAIFENSFSDDFLELAWVDVSENGRDYFRFPAVSLSDEAVGAYGTIEPALVDGFAGKYRQGFGTPFDLAALRDAGLGQAKVAWVRLVDVVGDGTSTDCNGQPLHDPYPTTGSAGFDLDAIAILDQAD